MTPEEGAINAGTAIVAAIAAFGTAILTGLGFIFAVGRMTGTFENRVKELERRVGEHDLKMAEDRKLGDERHQENQDALADIGKEVAVLPLLLDQVKELTKRIDAWMMKGRSS